jgi:hypothetical protein
VPKPSDTSYVEPFLKILIAKSECDLNDKKKASLFSHIKENKNAAKSEKCPKKRRIKTKIVVFARFIAKKTCLLRG